MFDLFRDTFPLLWLIIAKLGWWYHTYVCRFMECRLKKCRIKKSEWVISTIIFFLSGSLCLVKVKPIDVFSPELDREGLYGYIFVYSESSPRWGSRGSTREPRLTNSLTCQRSQANYWERPTRGNYNGQNLSNRNYSWKAGLFLPTSKGLARAGDKREGVGVAKTPLSAHNNPPPPLPVPWS